MDGVLEWHVKQLDGPGHVHVYPIDDLHEHHLCQSCPCHVRLEMVSHRDEDGDLVVGRTYIHRAWDGRK